MARLISVVHDGQQYGRRQMPFRVDDNLTMVLQFSDVCLSCEAVKVKSPEAETFSQRFKGLSREEMDLAMSVSKQDMFEQLSSLVPCVGCRKSVERLFDQLVLTGQPTLDPLVINKDNQLKLDRQFLFDPKLTYALFYVHGNVLSELLDSVTKSRKNKRCQLHSLDVQKSKFTGSWLELWDLLSSECKKSILLVDFNKFMEAMIVYLDKHRFCIECKTKVLRAHGLLVGEDSKKKEKGFCPALYEGITYCQKEKHLHVKNDMEFISNLIARAEPDLMGSRRERHAKTIDIAQEEVLSCLGVFLYTRFNNILQKLKLEEQTWKELFYVSVSCLKRNFEVYIEKKQGVSRLELICAEMDLAEKHKELKKEQKRQKKKKLRESKKVKEIIEQDPCSCEGEAECVGCVRCQQAPSPISSTITPDHALKLTCSTASLVSKCSCETNSDRGGSLVSHNHPLNSPPFYPKASACDLGYASGLDNCDSCSASSSGTDGQPDICIMHTLSVDGGMDQSLDHLCLGDTSCDCSLGSCNRGMVPSHAKFPSSLQDMLESHDQEKEDEYISEEDIQAFRANLPQMRTERLQLREKLKKQFDARMEQHKKNC